MATTETTEVGLQIPDDLRAMLTHTLDQYTRWIHEGMPRYGYQSRGGEQMYYDTYHKGMSGKLDGVLSFNIQIYDSPEGDTWWSGKVRVRPDGTLKILESSTSSAF